MGCKSFFGKARNPSLPLKTLLHPIVKQHKYNKPTENNI